VREPQDHVVDRIFKVVLISKGHRQRRGRRRARREHTVA
jgi:hypothetical protein